MYYTVKEQKKEKDIYHFGDLQPGEFFFDTDGDLILKIRGSSSTEHDNALIVDDAKLYAYYDDAIVIPVSYELHIYREVE